MPALRLGVVLLFPSGLSLKIDGIRQALGSVGPSRIAPHVTLVPPFNLPQSEIASLRAAITDVVDEVSPFMVEIGAASSFGEDSPVLYLTVRDLGDALQPLVSHLNFGKMKMREDRLYVPHVTLADHLSPEKVAAGVELLSGFEERVVVDRLTLLEKPASPVPSRWRADFTPLLGEVKSATRGGMSITAVVVGTPSRQLPESGEYLPIGEVDSRYCGVELFHDGKWVGSLGSQAVSQKAYELTHLRVFVPEHRDRGAGTFMLNTAIRYLSEAGVEYLASAEETIGIFLEGRGFEAVSVGGNAALGAIYGARSKLWSFSL